VLTGGKFERTNNYSPAYTRQILYLHSIELTNLYLLTRER